MHRNEGAHIIAMAQADDALAPIALTLALKTHDLAIVTVHQYCGLQVLRKCLHPAHNESALCLVWSVLSARPCYNSSTFQNSECARAVTVSGESRTMRAKPSAQLPLSLYGRTRPARYSSIDIP